jgi:antitoxin PrlF
LSDATTKVFLHPDGSVVRLPKRPVSALRGIAAGRRQAATIEEMEEAIAAAALDGQPRAKDE